MVLPLQALDESGAIGMAGAGSGQIPACPRCGATDRSQPVAAIIAGGTQVTEGSFWGLGAAWGDDDIVPMAMSGTTRSVQRTELVWPWFDGNPMTVLQGLAMTMAVGRRWLPSADEMSLRTARADPASDLFAAWGLAY